jgi:hypothetical protein
MRQVGKGRGTIVPDIFEGAVMTMLGDWLPPEMRKGAVELKQALERIMTGMPKTPYATVAKKWMEDPAARGKVKMVCISCHEPNRLGPRLVSAQGQ